jgi:hypothetical protein
MRPRSKKAHSFSYLMFAGEVDAIGFKVRVEGLEASFFLAVGNSDAIMMPFYDLATRL